MFDLWAVFRLQTLFAPATWAVPCIVAYRPPVVNNSPYARDCRVPPTIVRPRSISLKPLADPACCYLAIRAIWWIFAPVWAGQCTTSSGWGRAEGSSEADFDYIIMIIGNPGLSRLQGYSPRVRLRVLTTKGSVVAPQADGVTGVPDAC